MQGHGGQGLECVFALNVAASRGNMGLGVELKYCEPRDLDFEKVLNSARPNNKAIVYMSDMQMHFLMISGYDFGWVQYETIAGRAPPSPCWGR